MMRMLARLDGLLNLKEVHPRCLAVAESAIGCLLLDDDSMGARCGPTSWNGFPCTRLGCAAGPGACSLKVATRLMIFEAIGLTVHCRWKRMCSAALARTAPAYPIRSCISTGCKLEDSSRNWFRRPISYTTIFSIKLFWREKKPTKITKSSAGLAPSRLFIQECYARLIKTK